MIPKVSSLLNTCRELMARTNSISIVSSRMFVHVSLKIYLKADLPSLTTFRNCLTLSQADNLFLTLNFWKSRNPKNFGARVRFQVRYQQIASSTQRKRLGVALDHILLTYRDLTATCRCYQMCRLNRKIVRDVYGFSFKLIQRLPIPIISTESPSTKKFGTFTTFYPFLTTFPSSRFRISRFLSLGGWQVSLRN